MKERPILFSGLMVLALLDGRKTQTRRVANPQPTEIDGRLQIEGAQLIAAIFGRSPTEEDVEAMKPRCPYGVAGDRLWVKEAVRFGIEYDSDPPRDVDPVTFNDKINICTVRYEAGGPPQPETGWGKLRPSIFMPRWASRITLEVVIVRVERVEDITEADAIAEGFAGREHFLHTFYNLNKRAPRGTNPWVWVVEFKRVQP